MTPIKCWFGLHEWGGAERVPLHSGDILFHECCEKCDRRRRMWCRPISTDWIYVGSRFSEPTWGRPKCADCGRRYTPYAVDEEQRIDIVQPDRNVCFDCFTELALSQGRVVKYWERIK